MALKVVFGARQDASLLSRVDTFGAAAKIGTTAHANFDKGDRGAVAHYEIDFTVPATVVSAHQAQALVD